jgi:hypothetical protein
MVNHTHLVHSALRPTYTNGICGLDTASGLLSTANITDFVNGAHGAGVKAIMGIREDDIGAFASLYRGLNLAVAGFLKKQILLMNLGIWRLRTEGFSV